LDGEQGWWRSRAWKPIDYLASMGYTIVADPGSHILLARRGGSRSGWILAAPLDWPAGYTFTLRGVVYATIHEEVRHAPRMAVIREPSTLEPVALAEVEAGRRRLRLRVIEGSPPRWGILDPYTPQGLEPPSAHALRAGASLEPRLVILVRASSTPGASQGLQALPPGPVVAVAPCRRGEEWPGLAPGLGALRAAVRVCVEVEDWRGLPGARPGAQPPALPPAAPPG
jgi:hypothetical protein